METWSNMSNTLAIPAGLEPATLCLEGRCSIRLSYGTEVRQTPVKYDDIRSSAEGRKLHSEIPVHLHSEIGARFVPFLALRSIMFRRFLAPARRCRSVRLTYTR